MSYMENNPDFHGKAPNDEQLQQALGSWGSRRSRWPGARRKGHPRSLRARPRAAGPRGARYRLSWTRTLAYSTSAVKFGQEFPERFFPVGVAEQNMIGVAAGPGGVRKGGLLQQLRGLRAGPLLRPAADGGRPAEDERQAVRQPRRRRHRRGRRVCRSARGPGADALDADLQRASSRPTSVEASRRSRRRRAQTGRSTSALSGPRLPIIYDDSATASNSESGTACVRAATSH